MRYPRLTRASDGKPLRRLLVASKPELVEVLDFGIHDAPPMSNTQGNGAADYSNQIYSLTSLEYKRRFAFRHFALSMALIKEWIVSHAAADCFSLAFVAYPRRGIKKNPGGKRSAYELSARIAVIDS